MLDKNGLRQKNPVSYNNHIKEAEKAAKNTISCISILAGKIKRGECGCPPPKIPVSTLNHYQAQFLSHMLQSQTLLAFGQNLV
jgi:hypothetical protein